MNKFKHEKTILIKSEFDFARLKKTGSDIASDIGFRGKSNLSVSVLTPKDPDSGLKIQCNIKYQLGGDKDVIKILIESISSFEIESITEPEKYPDDAIACCRSEAVTVLNEKLNALLNLHLGSPLNIPFPSVD